MRYYPITQEEAFWVFVQIMEDILPINFYSELVGIMIDCTILNNMLSKYIPEIYEHLMNNGFELNMNNFIYKWFVSLFIQNFNEEYSLIIWDFLFLEGSVVIFKAALAIFMNMKNKILNHTNFEDIYAVFTDTPQEISDKKQLLYYLGLRHFEFDNIFINTNRKNFLKPVSDTIKEGKVDKLVKDKSLERKFGDCNREWPFCINDHENRILDLIKYQTGSAPKIVENYFFNGINSFYNNSIQLNFDDVLCERLKHYCEDKTINEIKSKRGKSL
jgi:hypothetical protein